jgi:hypothetical protein
MQRMELLETEQYPEVPPHINPADLAAEALIFGATLERAVRNLETAVTATEVTEESPEAILAQARSRWADCQQGDRYPWVDAATWVPGDPEL